MKVSALLFTLSLVSAAVKREAEPDADADPQVLHGHKPVSVSAPECHSVPELKCVPRQVETPRKVCHQEYDEIVDTLVTEHCEEVITTTCQQVSTKSILTKAVVGTDSKVVATGVAATPVATTLLSCPTTCLDRMDLVEVCWQVVVMTSSQCSVYRVSTISSYSW